MADTRLDKIQDDVSEIKTDIALIKADLKVHIKRSDQNEARIDALQTQSDKIIGAANFIKIVGIMAAIAESIHMMIR